MVLTLKKSLQSFVFVELIVVKWMRSCPVVNYTGLASKQNLQLLSEQIQFCTTNILINVVFH